MKKLTILLPVIAVAFAGCKKINNGFLSDTLRYIDKEIYCQRGLALVQTKPIDFDGSTPPVTFKMLNLRDESGKPAPKEFFEKYEVIVFKPGMTFDAKTDTTVAELNKKREKKTVPPMEFNPVSGQMSFNRGTANIPLGKYTFDLEAQNSNSTKTYPAIANINIVDPKGSDLFVEEASAAAVFHNVTGASTTIRNPRITCTKVSNDGARVIMKIVDKDGRTFNPKAGEIIKRGDRPIFENYAKFNPVIITDTAMICDFEVSPFPLAKYIDNTGYDWGHLMYYRIPSQFVTIDNFTPGLFSANPRWAFVVKMEGTYIVEVRLTDCTKVN